MACPVDRRCTTKFFCVSGSYRTIVFTVEVDLCTYEDTTLVVVMNRGEDSPHLVLIPKLNESIFNGLVVI
jgi:hypothetical protein